MKEVIQHEKLGEIVYEENFWTGKKSLQVNGVRLQKTNKKTFVTESGEYYVINGNYIQGAVLAAGEETVRLTQPVKWYEIVLSVLPFLLIMVWGNVVALCEIVPVVGGLIGGGISAVLSCLNLFIIKGVKPIWLKVVISIAILGVTFGICCGIGYAIIAAAQQNAAFFIEKPYSFIILTPDCLKCSVTSSSAFVITRS